jgi:DNA gyrase/topoisomerase IV subunit B
MFKAESWRDNKHSSQEFTEDQDGDDMIRGELKVRQLRGVNRGKTGTKITFSPSTDVYEDVTLPIEFVSSRCQEIAAAYPSLRMYFNGVRIGGERTTEKILFGDLKPLTISIRGEMNTGGGKHRVLKGRGVDRKADFKSDFYLLPNFCEEGEAFHSLVNGIAAYRGGSQMDAFRRSFYKLAIEALSTEARKRKLDKSLDRKDIMEGLLIYNVTIMPAPNFDTQNKQKLVSKDAEKIISESITLAEVKKIFRANPEWVKQILDNCEKRVGNQGLKDAMRESKKAIKKRVAKLKDANGRSRSKCILFLAEGDSAIEGMNNLRNPEIHGGLPLRGKVMNVNGVNPAKVVKSDPLLDIMNAVGLQIGQKAVPSDLRYGKIYIATDEDEDGGNITALIVNFLYTFWPELFDKKKPMVYKFETPFIILIKGGKRNYIFGKDYAKFNPSDWKGWDIVRAKGVGRLEQEDWKNMLDSPSLIPIVDDGHLEEALDLMFNGDLADERKGWLS